MTTLMRGTLWVAWLVVVGWLWRLGVLGAAGATLGCLFSVVLLAWPATGRRRRSVLRYVEMGKQPLGLR